MPSPSPKPQNLSYITTNIILIITILMIILLTLMVILQILMLMIMVITYSNPDSGSFEHSKLQEITKLDPQYGGEVLRTFKLTIIT